MKIQCPECSHRYSAETDEEKDQNESTCPQCGATFDPTVQMVFGPSEQRPEVGPGEDTVVDDLDSEQQEDEDDIGIDDDSSFLSQQNSQNTEHEPGIRDTGPLDDAVFDEKPLADDSPESPQSPQSTQSPQSPEPGISPPGPPSSSETLRAREKTDNSEDIPSSQDPAIMDWEMESTTSSSASLGQTLANIFLGMLVVVTGFVTLVSGLNGWFIDFKRFPHMLQIAFQGAEFQPRQEWQTTTAVGDTGADDTAQDKAFEIQSSFFVPLTTREDTELVAIKGIVKNISTRQLLSPSLEAVVRQGPGDRILERAEGFILKAPMNLAELSIKSRQSLQTMAKEQTLERLLPTQTRTFIVVLEKLERKQMLTNNLAIEWNLESPSID
jgi:hypothetical protein